MNNKKIGYRKYDKSFSNKNGIINRMTASFSKLNIPIMESSNQNVLTTARTRDGFFFFLHSSSHFLRKKKEIFHFFRNVEQKC